MITAKEARKIASAHNNLVDLYDAIEEAAKEGKTEIIFGARGSNQQSLELIEEDLKKNGYKVFSQYGVLFISW